jgi:hypothetical protein
MKTLKDYFENLQVNTGDANMRLKKIVAEQNDQGIALWNTEQDRWSRRAKHPLRINEISIENPVVWEQGEIAIYESQQVEISIPDGPDGTTGIILEGRTKMVMTSKLTKLDENVLGGMQPLNPINRIMQLAGISVPATLEPAAERTEESAGSAINNEDVVDDILEEADSTNMFESLFRANLNGEYRNNPDAARLATIGDIMVGLESQITPLHGKVTPDLESKLNVAVGLGAALITAAKAMLKPQQPGA